MHTSLLTRDTGCDPKVVDTGREQHVLVKVNTILFIRENAALYCRPVVAWLLLFIVISKNARQPIQTFPETRPK